jgi:hypothetical protein
MADSGFLLERKSIFIVIGSFEAGLTHQLSRILRFDMTLFRPVPTYVTSDAIVDTIWFRRISPEQLYGADVDSLFTFYEINDVRYYVKRRDVRMIIEQGFVALVGMTNEGYARFLSIADRTETADRNSDFEHALRQKSTTREYHTGIGAVEHAAVSIGPEDVSEFAQALMRDLRMPYERAIECARRAVATSTIPPKSSGSYRLHIPIRGPKDEVGLERLASFIKVRSSK